MAYDFRDKKGRFRKGIIPANKGQMITLPCIKCQVFFEVRPYRRETAKFCSRSCAASWQGFRRKWTKEVREKIGKAHRGKKLPEHQRQKISAYLQGRIGELARNWKGGLTALKYGERYSTPYRMWVTSVKNRDGWKCKISNGDCSGRLEAHHILAWRSHIELRYEINNGITLCHYHHPRKRTEELEKSPYFQQLVGEAH